MMLIASKLQKTLTLGLVHLQVTNSNVKGNLLIFGSSKALEI